MTIWIKNSLIHARYCSKEEIALELRQMPSPMPDNDAATAGGQREAGIAVDVPGRYWLWNSRDLGGDLKQFACRVIDISPQAMVLVAPVRGSIGEWVSADIEHFGRLDGAIGRPLDHRGFVMNILTTAEERGRLAKKIEWYDKYRNSEVPDRRTRPRSVAEHPFSTLLLEDGAVMSCLVTDLSASGAAVLADIVPEIGTVLAVGKVIGRVNRHFPGGFAVNFVFPQQPQNVEKLVYNN
jgi:hypothetical protein